MSIVADIALLATSFTAVIYCMILSRRLDNLKKLTVNFENSLSSLAKTVENARATVALAQKSSARGVQELSPLIAEAETLAPKLTSLIDVMSDLAETKISELHEVAEETRRQMEEQLVALDAVILQSGLNDSPGAEPIGELPADDYFASPIGAGTERAA